MYTFRVIRQATIISLFFLSFGLTGNIIASESASEILVTDIHLKNVKSPNSQLVIGGQPSIADLQKLVNLGIKNVINLRGTGEFSEFDEAAEAEKLGLNYFSLPIDGAKDVTFENAQRLHLVQQSLQGKTLLHCASGNRVGALHALSLANLPNMSLEQIILQGKAFGMTSLEPKVRELIQQELGKK